MEAQNYANHRQLVPAFHYVLLPLLLVTLIGSAHNLYISIATDDHQRLSSAVLILAMMISFVMLAFLSRIFALKAQDRAIRAEENLRHYALTGKLLDARLTPRQITGLRFASDAEFPALAQRAAAENLAVNDIKKAVKNWRPDTYRV